MKVGMSGKIIIGIVGILVLGFIGFQVLKVQSPDVEKPQKVIKVVSRRITMPPFVERIPETVVEETVMDPPQEEANIKPLEIETTPIPESVPTAESDDAEIKEFQAWLSSILEQEDAGFLEETEQEDFNTEDDEIDYTFEKSAIKSVIQGQWEHSFENYDIEGYMSAIWEDGFFYVSDMGTPDNLRMMI